MGDGGGRIGDGEVAAPSAARGRDILRLAGFGAGGPAICSGSGGGRVSGLGGRRACPVYGLRGGCAAEVLVPQMAVALSTLVGFSILWAVVLPLMAISICMGWGACLVGWDDWIVPSYDAEKCQFL